MTTFGLFMWMLALIIYMHGTEPHRESLAGLLVGLGAASMVALPIVRRVERLIAAFVRCVNRVCQKASVITPHRTLQSIRSRIPAVQLPTDLYTSQSTHMSTYDVTATNQSASPLSMSSAARERGTVEVTDWPQVRRTGDMVAQRYLVFDLVARTGYRIYRALDIWTSQLVGIKQCAPPTPAIDIPPEVLERCLANEADILRILPSGIAPSVVEVFQEGVALTLVTTWMLGQMLRDVLNAGSLSLDEALWLALRICDAVTALHHLAPPLLHKDLKPENLIILPSGQVIPIDFGIATWLVPEAKKTEPMGTLPYSAPEQRQGEPVDERTDVYALGMILREVLECYGHIPAISNALDRATAELQYQRTPTVIALRADLVAARLELLQSTRQRSSI